MSDELRNGRSIRFQNVLTPILVIIGFAVQWGIFANQISELTRRIGVLEEKIDNRMMSRDEFEKRHAELERRVQQLERQEELRRYRRAGEP